MKVDDPATVGHFFVPPDGFAGDGRRLVLSGDLAHHVARVLRARPGERITACVKGERGGEGEGEAHADGRDVEYLIRLDEVGPARTTGVVEARREAWTEPRVEVVLCQGLPKGDKMDLVVQKAVELGVYGIIPVITSRAVPELTPAKAASRLSRWRRVAIEAAQQSRRSRVPWVGEPATLGELLRGVERGLARGAGSGEALALWEGERRPLEAVLAGMTGDERGRRIYLFVGPEGGFSPEEVDAFHGAGVRTAALGPRILRTETAAVAGVSVLLFYLGELGPRDPSPWISLVDATL